MSLGVAPSDLQFRVEFEAGRVPPSDFDHRGHLRLAYVYLSEGSVEEACGKMQAAIRGFLARNGVDPSKYHETITRAWILAVEHFRQKAGEADSFEAFVALHPVMLDSKIMLTHYSAELLFSAAARDEFVAPDLDPIPRYRA